MSLYLKYRPRTIDELDLDGVRATLEGIVKANQISHAYLLTGPRGAGKTSTARVIARIVNCEKNTKKLAEPCNECDACHSILDGSALDFVEIDAASNRGIDDIRELKDKIRLAPSTLKYKVYIIDEVHMLTTEAFNALLKTLEEPPAHALFILCTTETHKVPETIVSRCVRIHFTKATVSEMKRSLERVVKGEEKEVSVEALEYLAGRVDGSFRDGVKILEQVLSGSDKVGLAEMEKVVSGSSGYRVDELVAALVTKNTDVALAKLHEASGAGVDLLYLTVEIMKGLRDNLLMGGGVELTKLVFAMDEVARKLGTSPVPELLLEVAVIEWGGNPASRQIGGSADQKTSTPAKTSKPASQLSGKPEKLAVNLENRISDNTESLNSRKTDHKEVWSKLMAGLNGDSVTMGALLSKAIPAQIQGDELTIQVKYGFHRDQILTEKVLGKLEKMVSEVMGKPMKVKCEVAAGVTIAQAEVEVDQEFAEAESIFGKSN